MQGQIYKIHSDFYYVKNSEFEFECKLKETLKKQKENVFVGDFVELSDDNRFVVKIIKRKNYILRPKVANIDIGLIVASFKEPELDFMQLDRYLTFLNYHRISSAICLNKEDLEDNLIKLQDKIKDIYKDIETDIFFISARDNIGIDVLKEYLNNKTVALCGQSGVGKSTLVNTLNPELNLKTGMVSEKTQKGTHTTRHVEILDCDNFRIIDTPGFSNLKFDFILPEKLIDYFPDIKRIKSSCKYSDCLHDVKTNGLCSVYDNLDKISLSRYKSYLNFLKECKDYKKEISNKSIKDEKHKKQAGTITLTKISKQKRNLARNTIKQRIKQYDINE